MAPGRPGRAWTGFGRLASDFAAAELIDLAAAESIVDGLELALAARSRLEPRRAWAMRRSIRRQRGSLPVGQVVAIPLGLAVAVQSEDGPIQLVLLALVLAPDRAEVTVAGRLAAVPDGGARRHHDRSGPLEGLGHRRPGRQVRGTFHRRVDESRIDGALSFRPIPPAQARWLEVRVGETDPVRVQLAGSQPVTADLDEEPGGTRSSAFWTPAPSGSSAIAGCPARAVPR